MLKIAKTFVVFFVCFSSPLLWDWSVLHNDPTAPLDHLRKAREEKILNCAGSVLCICRKFTNLKFYLHIASSVSDDNLVSWWSDNLYHWLVR